MNVTDKKLQGKKNKQSGARFELKVRKDLEKMGWIVSKWMNNVELLVGLKIDNKQIPYGCVSEFTGKLIHARHKFRGKGIMAIGTGFPDFIVFKRDLKGGRAFQYYEDGGAEVFVDSCIRADVKVYDVMGVEAKSNGYLDKEECAKCEWLLKNNIFTRILIAQKGEKRGEIIYKEYGKNI